MRCLPLARQLRTRSVPLFLTREPTPAHFVGGPFLFTPLANLIETLEEPAQP